jgi:hypothetical protein
VFLLKAADKSYWVKGRGWAAMTLYGDRCGAVRPVLQVGMPRLPRLYSPGATMQVITRCNHREVNSTARVEFEIGG